MADLGLTVDEKIRLSTLEERIDRGMKGFVEAGLALAAIRDERLYRIEFSTFEDYCQSRWSISRPRAYELIGAAEVVQSLSATADKNTKLPDREWQVRPLTKVPEEKRPEVWAEAVELAGEEKVTRTHVEAAIGRKDIASKPRKPEPIQQGQTAIVTDLDHPSFGQQVKVVKAEREIIHAATAAGKTEVFMTGELQPLSPQQQVEQLASLLKEVVGEVGEQLSEGLLLRIEAAIA